MAIRTVFFDLGGTLLVMRRDKIVSKILTDVGYPVAPRQVHSSYFSVEPSWLSIYGEKVMSGEETEEAYRQLDALIFQVLFPDRPREEVERVSGLTRKLWPVVEKSVPPELYPDVMPTLGRLETEGYTLGLVSNAPPDTVKVIEFLGLQRYLTVIVVSGVVGVSKPNPEIFKIATKRAGVEPSDAIHIGDVYEADVLGARNAGIKALLIDRDGSQPNFDCPCVKSLSEIYPHLR